jgi:cell division protein FtsZ
MLEFAKPELTELKPRIAVVGVGGAGCNAVANMIAADLMGVEFIVANTDAQQLAMSPAATRIQLGMKITQGLGAGARPEIGRAAAEETLDQLESALEGAHMCFIAAGMGGGTGTGAAPVVARAARERGILTVGVVTKPFNFEGAKRARAAEEGIAELQKHVDTLIIIPNQNLFLIANASTTFKDAFAMADQVLHQGVRGITDLMIMPGLINLDFADIRTVMSEMGKAMMGTGEASGDRRAIEAAEKAIANPLLDEVSMRGAKGVIINITGGDDLKLMEVDEAASHIRDMVDPEANIIVGSAFNKDLDGVMRVSVVATGIDASARPIPVKKPEEKKPAFGGQSSIFGQGGIFPPAGATVPEPAPAPVPAPMFTLPPASVEPEPEVAEPVAEDTAPLMALEPPGPAHLATDEDDDDVIDLGAVAERVETAPAVSYRFSPPPAPVAAVEAPAPADNRPTDNRVVPLDEHRARMEAEPARQPSLFERMRGLGGWGKPAPAPAPTTLAPEPGPAAAGPESDDTAIPAFLKNQVNG